MPHLYDIFPWYFRMLGLKNRSKHIGCLAYYLYAFDESKVSDPVSNELFI